MKIIKTPSKTAIPLKAIPIGKVFEHEDGRSLVRLKKIDGAASSPGGGDGTFLPCMDLDGMEANFYDETMIVKRVYSRAELVLEDK